MPLIEDIYQFCSHQLTSLRRNRQQWILLLFFVFIVPPYNSIDHLHLHAIQKPYRNLWSRFMFAERFRWHGSLESVLEKLPSEKAKL